MGCASSSRKDVVLSALSRTPIGRCLPDAELLEFAACFDVRRFEEGATVLSPSGVAGRDAPALFVIHEGAADVSFEDTFLCVKGPGEFFGQLASQSALLMERKGTLHRMGVEASNDMDGDGSKPKNLGQAKLTKRESFIDSERLSTVRARTALTCAVLGLDRMRAWLKEKPPRLVEDVVTAMGSGTVKNLQALPFFADLPEAKVHVLSAMLHYVPLHKGETVFEEGSVGDSLYIVYQGSCRAVAARKEDGAGGGGGKVVLNTFSEADFFGEISLLVDMPRTASIEATAESLLLELRKDDFQNFLKVAPNLHFNELMKRRFAAHFRKYNVPFFAAIPESKYPLLASLCKVEQYEPGAVIFSEGDVGSTFYIIAHGDLRVTAGRRRSVVGGGSERVEGETVELGRLGQGSYFGELALLRDTKRMATVTTVTRSVILSITKENFDVFFKDVPEALSDFEVKLARYEVAMRSVIYHPVGLKYFTSFLEREYSAENIRFWEEARAYRHIGTTQAGGALLGFAGARASAEDLEAAAIRAQNQYEPDGVAAAPAADGGDEATAWPTDEAAAAVPPRPTVIARPGDDEEPLTPRTLDELRARARKVFDRFISTDATEQVNISGESQRLIGSQVRTGNVTRLTFAPAEREVLALLERDSFPRWKQSDSFRAFLDETDTYAEEKDSDAIHQALGSQPTMRSGSVVEDERNNKVKDAYNERDRSMTAPPVAASPRKEAAPAEPPAAVVEEEEEEEEEEEDMPAPEEEAPAEYEEPAAE